MAFHAIDAGGTATGDQYPMKEYRESPGKIHVDKFYITPIDITFKTDYSINPNNKNLLG